MSEYTVYCQNPKYGHKVTFPSAGPKTFVVIPNYCEQCGAVMDDKPPMRV